MRVFSRTIRSLVDENYVYARALSYLGIDFYLAPDRQLSDVCAEMGLNKSQVLKTFYLFDRSYRFSFQELKRYPLEIVIEYLKHTHNGFIKERIPYIARLVSRYPHNEDMRLIFPEFVEEFISHIYEEEDTVFNYVFELLNFEKGKSINLHAFLKRYERISLKGLHKEHREEDELAGIRNLVEESGVNDIHWQVIVKEIRAFDREMWYHAEIENKIMFPKAIALEAMVREKIVRLGKLN